MFGGQQQFGGGFGGQGSRNTMGMAQGGMAGVDQAQLVNTLVNVATNILSGAGHYKHQT